MKTYKVLGDAEAAQEYVRVAAYDGSVSINTVSDGSTTGADLSPAAARELISALTDALADLGDIDVPDDLGGMPDAADHAYIALREDAYRTAVKLAGSGADVEAVLSVARFVVGD